MAVKTLASLFCVSPKTRTVHHSNCTRHESQALSPRFPLRGDDFPLEIKRQRAVLALLSDNAAPVDPNFSPNEHKKRS